MKIPETILICNHEWSVVYTESKLDKMGVIGLCDRPSCTIYLHSNLKGNSLTKVFFHELFHALTYEYSITDNIQDETEEILVDVFANFMAENFYIRPKNKLLE